MSGLQQPSSFTLMDRLEPRPPPRLPLVPSHSPLSRDFLTPPRPTVPDVSLVFDSSGFKSGSGSTSAGYETPDRFTNSAEISIKNTHGLSTMTTNAATDYPKYTCRSEDTRNVHKLADRNDRYTRNIGLSQRPYGGIPDSNSDDLKILISMVSKHEGYMVRMERQINDLVDFQNNFLANLIKRGSSLHKEVQTDTDEHCCNRSNDDCRSLSSASSCSSESFQSLPQSNSSKKKQFHSSSKRPFEDDEQVFKPDRTHQTKPVGSNDNKSSGQINQETELQRPHSSESNRSNGREKTEDLSAILRDLQIPSVQENSVYSDASIRLLDLQEYHDDSINSNNENGSPHIGPSVSAYGSYSSEDENSPPPIKPTVTFYKNVLGNVNRLLENDGNNKEHGSFHHSTAHNRAASKSSNKKQTIPGPRNAANFPATGSSGRSSFTSDNSRDTATAFQTGGQSNGRQMGSNNGKDESNDVGDATKRYLEHLGVQFTPNNEKKTSSNPNEKHASYNPNGSQANFMIQQNVYNSIFIPTLNCVPLAPESLGSSSGQFNDLANKYIPQEDLQQYKAVQDSQKLGANSTETTMYGMTSNHLSFATKQYLQRYGLVNQGNPTCDRVEEQPHRPRPIQYTKFFNDVVGQSTDRILDLTALRNQPKLM